MRRPSGDGVGLLSGPLRVVSWRVSPLATSTRYTSDSRQAYSQSSVRRPLKSSALPSGVQRAPPWFQSPLVTWRGVPPSVETTNRCVNPSGRKPCRSARYFTLVTTRGASVHLAPLGAGGRASGHDSRLGTCIWNAMCLPSGDQEMPLGDSTTRVTCDDAPSASIQRTKICDPPGSPGARYTMRVPSGDHCAAEPFTRKRFFVPSAFMSHSADSRLSFTPSIHVRVYRICWPSGESCGLLTSCQLK